MVWKITPASTTWAEGGDVVYTINVSGTTYRVHEFRSTREATLSVMKSGSFQYLLVGGGGAGAGNNSNAGGGGGAGGLLTGTISLSAQAYPITVGSGGLPVINGTGNKGSDTTAFGLIALGGGAGVPGSDATSSVNNGGSGGGAGQDANPSSKKGQGTQGQGNNGGNSSGTGSGGGGGGGGGAGGVGQDGTSSKGGDGGPGIPLSLTGSVIFYAGGGGATQTSPGTNPGLGGTGGGGNAATSGAAQNGTDGLGGGGGACRSFGIPGRGGSGIVIVRYVIA